MGRTRSSETERIIEAVKTIVHPDNPWTARFVLYKLISTGVLESTNQYDKLLNILRDARQRGDLDDDCFLDNKRTIRRLRGHTNLADYVEFMRRAYHRCRWDNQTNLPLVLVEKGTVGDVLEGICDEFQVPLFISSGYYSRPFLCRLAEMIVRRGNAVRIGYVGDGDPSGFDIERAARKGNDLQGSARREGLFEILNSVDSEAEWTFVTDSDRTYMFREEEIRVTWERLAITNEDLASFKGSQLVSVKPGDSRAVTFVEEHGAWAKRGDVYYGAEVEALDLEELQDRVRLFIRIYVDDEAWAETERLELEDLEKLSKLTT